MSGDTRSTTATIRPGLANANISKQKRIKDQIDRAAGKKIKDAKIKNPDAIKPCPYCQKLECYNPENPHSSRRSKKCPNHIMNTNEYLEAVVGRNFRRCTRKTGLSSAIIYEGIEKEAFLRVIRETVEDYREIAIKSQLFASYFINHCLFHNEPLDLIIFSQPFFYACIQKVLGRTVSSPNRNLPKDLINSLFERYIDLFPTGRVVLVAPRTVSSHALASLAINSASNLTNSITEKYNGILQKYIKIRVNEFFVSTIEH